MRKKCRSWKTEEIEEEDKEERKRRRRGGGDEKVWEQCEMYPGFLRKSPEHRTHEKYWTCFVQMQKESGLETETMLATILHWTWSLHSKWNKFKDPSNSITYTAMNLIMFDLNPVKGRLIHVALSESGTVAITHLLLQLRIHQWSQWRIMMVLCN